MRRSRIGAALVCVSAIAWPACGATSNVQPVITAPLARAGAPAPDLAAAVLTARDLGNTYTVNAGATGPLAIGPMTAGDGASVRSLFDRSWTGSYAVGLTSSDVRRPGVWCAVHVFRSANLRPVLKAWKRDDLRALNVQGTIPIPAAAPGKPLWLIRGSIPPLGKRAVSYDYVWRTGHVLVQLWVSRLRKYSKGLEVSTMQIAQLTEQRLLRSLPEAHE
jgi:hypothetical protein